MRSVAKMAQLTVNSEAGAGGAAGIGAEAEAI